MHIKNKLQISMIKIMNTKKFSHERLNLTWKCTNFNFAEKKKPAKPFQF